MGAAAYPASRHTTGRDGWATGACFRRAGSKPTSTRSGVVSGVLERSRLGIGTANAPIGTPRCRPCHADRFQSRRGAKCPGPGESHGAPPAHRTAFVPRTRLAHGGWRVTGPKPSSQNRLRKRPSPHPRGRVSHPHSHAHAGSGHSPIAPCDCPRACRAVPGSVPVALPACWTRRACPGPSRRAAPGAPPARRGRWGRRCCRTRRGRAV